MFWVGTLLIPFGIILMHLVLFRLGTFQVNVAVLVGSLVPLLLLPHARIPRRVFIFGIAVVCYQIVLAAFLGWDTEFLKSLAYLVNYVFVLSVVLGARLADVTALDRAVRLLLMMGIGVAALIILQGILGALGNFALSAPFGGRLAPGPGGSIYDVSTRLGLPRPNGIYSEPSVAGWIMTFVVAIALAQRNQRLALRAVAVCLCSAAALATLSISGFVNLTVIALCYLAVTNARRVRVGLWISTAATLAIIGSLFVNSGTATRLNNITTPGSSVYYRLTAPLLLLRDALGTYPFGYPVGETGYVASRPYMINWSAGSSTNIDNTVLLFVFHFGFVGIIGFVLLLSALLRGLRRGERAAIVAVALLLAMAETGSGWTHSFTLLMGMTILLGRAGGWLRPTSYDQGWSGASGSRS